MALAVGVAQFVGLVDDDHIPRHGRQLVFHAGGEVDGHDADDVTVQRVVDAAFTKPVPGACIEHFGGQVELVGQFLRPLLAQGRRANHQQAAPALCPQLAQHQCSFNGFAQTHLVGQYHAFAERVLEREERGVNLVWVEVNAGVKE
ncbi:hypothetical protein D9M68_868870 [compost metagenome]